MTITEDENTVVVPRRLNFRWVLPEAYRAMSALHETSEGLGTSLVDLVCLRTAQLNGCSFCLDMHSKDAAHHGDTTYRLFQLEAWREASCFTARERAALGLTDAVTLVRETHVPDDVWDEAAAAFDEKELAALVAAIVSSNSWNRVNIATREPAGAYEPSD
jgi:AhpD family alkylhydroperoxidase